MANEEYLKINEEHLIILEQGAEVWNRWREMVSLTSLDFSGRILSDFDLEGTNLMFTDFSYTTISDCNLNNADLSDAKMYFTIMENVELAKANLSSSSINNTIFNYCNLEKANFKNTNIYSTIFCEVNFIKTDFNYALIGDNSFSNVDLSLAKGLEGVTHNSPSTIGIDTLYKSAGKIPENFLRGCGIPDDFITFVPSIIGAQQAIQFYSCFISYSTKDEEFARRLYSRMRDEKLRVWFAPEDIKGGEKLFEQIERAIQIHDRLLIILSEESMRSEWVMTEIRRARKTEIEQKRRKLFPIRLVDFETIRNWERIDADSGMDIAAEVRSYFIPDFSDWKNHDSFEKGFARLLRDLRAEEERQSAQAETRQ